MAVTRSAGPWAGVRVGAWCGEWYVEVCVFAAGGGCGVWSKLFLTEALMP